MEVGLLEVVLLELVLLELVLLEVGSSRNTGGTGREPGELENGRMGSRKTGVDGIATESEKTAPENRKI